MAGSVFTVDGDDDNDDNDDENSNPLEEFSADGKENKGKGDNKGGTDAPIANADSIPLFPDADKRGVRTAYYIKVYKLDQPHSGYKGQVPLTSTEETIAQLCGNGLFRFDVCNGSHKVLRSKENVRIDIPSSHLEKISDGRSKGPETDILGLFKEINKSHERDIERTSKSAEIVNTQVQQNSKDFVTLIQALTQSAAERERAFLTSTSAGQQEFFKSMLASQGQQFSQLMAIMMMSHNQTIEMMKASSSQQNPLIFLEVMMKGLALGKDMGGDDDAPDWLKAIREGKDMFSSLADIAKIKALGTPPALTTPPPTSTPVPEPKKDTTQKPKKEQKLFSKNEITQLIQLKKTLLNRGIDLETLIKEANNHYSSDTAPDNKSEVDSDENSEEETDDELDDSTVGKTDVE